MLFLAPLINDVTTTPKAPPAYVALALVPANKGRDMSYPPGNAAVQARAYPDLVPLVLPRDPDACFKEVEAAAKRMTRWEVVSADASARRLEAVATTLLMRYKDDVVVEARPDPAGCTVNMRSKSRLGTGDFGKNAERIRAFLSLLKRKG